jgi:pilus assembly protein CpaB
LLSPKGDERHSITASPRIAWTGCVDRAEETDKVPFATLLAAIVRGTRGEFMRPKSLMLLVLALGCGLVASIGISQVMDRNSKRPNAAATTPIYIALHNINLGDPIDASMVSLQEWPKDRVPPGAISQLEDLEGRRPRTAIIQGEPLLDAKLLAPGQLADPITSIPKGFRLKTISVDAEKSAAGLLSPGDRVDVQLFVKRDERNGIDSARTKVILQNIRVFAVDQTVQRSPDGGEDRTIAKTISLLLTPEQASKLTLAENLGQVSLTPRNPNDEDSADTPEYSTEDLLADGGSNTREKEQARDEKEEPPQESGGLLSAIQQYMPPPRPPFVMEIVEAQDVREMKFDADTGKPIRDGDGATDAKSLHQDNTPQGAPTMAPPQGDPTDAQDLLKDFPVNFN